MNTREVAAIVRLRWVLALVGLASVGCFCGSDREETRSEGVSVSGSQFSAATGDDGVLDLEACTILCGEAADMDPVFGCTLCPELDTAGGETAAEDALCVPDFGIELVCTGVARWGCID